MAFPTPNPLRTLPRAHLCVLGGTCLLLALATWLLPGRSDGNAPAGDPANALAALPERPAAEPLLATALSLPPAAPIAEPAADPPPPAGPPWQAVAVRPGDSLARIFQRQGLPARDLQAVLDSGDLARRLGRIFPGHQLGFQQQDGRLLALRYAAGPLETLEFRLLAGRFEGRVLRREPDRVATYREATIEHSLFMASQRAGLDDELTMRLANIFQWDIDFVLDIRRGDSFHLLFEELWLDGEKIGNGRILAAEFINQGSPYRAVLWEGANGAGQYYAPDGRSMRKAFLRAPVEFSRISSNFNLRRRHPIHNTVRPHRGIDYAAPTGTPVLAAGDGRVVVARQDNASGKHVVLQHGEQYQTKYLHLSRFASGVREGRRVQQGDVIGYVGSTGWATGPHLHYEFLVSGVHHNPRTVTLPKAAPVAADDFERFRAATTPLLQRLDGLRDNLRLADVDPGRAPGAGGDG